MTGGNTTARPIRRALGWIGTAGLAAALAACGGGGGGGEAAVGQGTLRVALTDAPSCGYDHVWVTVEKVRVHKSSAAAESDAGWSEVVVSPALRVDLLELTNGLLKELGSTQLEAGSYSQVRLQLASNGATGDSSIANAVQPTGGDVIPLNTPSAQQSGLKLQAKVDVESGQTADLVLDFDACKSIVRAGNSGKYNLKPVVSVVPRVSAGIQGYVTTTLSLGSTTVSAQQNGVTVRSTQPDASGKFSIPYLSTGTYTVVVMSDGRASSVVTGVPVGTTTTVINGSATPLMPPASAMADVGGMFTVTTVSGSGTVSTALTDATVRALQPLPGGPTIELGSQAVDSVAGTYRFRLPVEPPVKAPYSAAGPLAFTAETAAKGKYTVQGQSPGRATQDKAADISSGTGATVDFSYGP